MPVYIGIVLKILSDFVLILTEHCFPKIVYIHIGQMFLHKFRFTSQLIVRIIAQVCEDFYHSCALCRKTAWSSLHTSKTLTAEKQSGGITLPIIPMAVIASAAVPPIHTVKERVVFFRAQREKISTLKPLTARIFAAVFSPPKTWNRMRADAQQGDSRPAIP